MGSEASVLDWHTHDLHEGHVCASLKLSWPVIVDVCQMPTFVRQVRLSYLSKEKNNNKTITGQLSFRLAHT